MIRGQVNARRHALIPVQLHGPGGLLVDVEAMVDTGFSTYLTLPPALIAALQLPFDRTEIYTLGDNRNVAFDLYLATIVWDGQDRAAWVLASDSEPLVGMALLQGYHLFVDVVDGGDVLIRPRP